jgi:hypothetical protein
MRLCYTGRPILTDISKDPANKNTHDSWNLKCQETRFIENTSKKTVFLGLDRDQLRALMHTAMDLRIL